MQSLVTRCFNVFQRKEELGSPQVFKSTKSTKYGLDTVMVIALWVSLCKLILQSHFRVVSVL